MWDYKGAQYVTCGGVPISSSAGSVMNFPNLRGSIQVFVDYHYPVIKTRVLYNGKWSNWYQIATSESSL